MQSKKKLDWQSMVREARAKLFHRRVSDPPYPALPYLAPLASRLRLVRTHRPLVAAAHPDGVVEFGSRLEEFLEAYKRLNGLPEEVAVAFILLHEVGHYFTLTWEREALWKEIHPEVRVPPEVFKIASNIAFDLVINQAILSLGLPVRPGYLPEDFSFPRGLSAENYLSLLLERFSLEPQGLGGEGEEEAGEEEEACQSGGSAKEEGQSEGEGKGGQGEAEEEESEGNPERERAASLGRLSEEEGDGEGMARVAAALGLPHRNPLVEAPPLSSPEETVEEADPSSPGELSQLEPLGERGERLPFLLKQIETQVQALPPGTVPDTLRFLISQAASGLPLPWNLILRRRLRKALGRVQRQARGRKTYPHPHEGVHRAIWKHYAGTEKGVLRARRQERLPRLGIVWDTSGSTLHDLGSPGSVQERFLREVQRLLREVREATVYLTHTEVYQNLRLTLASSLSLKDLEMRSGGTDMRRGIAQAEADGVDLCVVLTDGETPWPERPPRVPLLLVLTGEPSMPLPSWFPKEEIIFVPS